MIQEIIVIYEKYLDRIWGDLSKDDKIRLEGHFNGLIEVNPIKQYGHYEMYSNNGEYHAEGGLWFDDGVLSDYDGIFELPETIKTKLVEWGFIVEGE